MGVALFVVIIVKDAQRRVAARAAAQGEYPMNPQPAYNRVKEKYEE